MPITAKATITVTWDALRPPWWIKPMLELIASGETAGEARTGRLVVTRRGKTKDLPHHEREAHHG